MLNKLLRPRYGSRALVVLFIVIGAACGLAFGGIAYRMLYASSEAVAVIDLGSLGAAGRTFPVWLRFPDILQYVQSPSFAKIVARQSNTPEFERMLPATRFGGAGAMVSRKLRGENQLEIRVRAEKSGTALAAVDGAVHALISELTNSYSKVASKPYPELAEINTDLAQIRALKDATSARILSELKSDKRLRTVATLLHSYSELGRYAIALQTRVDALKISPTAGKTAAPSIVVEPSLSRSLIGSLTRMLLLGALAGVALGAFGYGVMRSTVGRKHSAPLEGDPA